MELLEHYRKKGITKDELKVLHTLMNPDFRDHVQSELGACEPLKFLERYCELDPEFATRTEW